MTTTPERRTATLSELVAQEIGAALGRRRWSQAQLARAIGKTQMWVSLRMRGIQPFDLNDLMIIAKALDVGVHELLPPPDVAAGAASPPTIPRYLDMAVRSRSQDRPRDNRPSAHAGVASLDRVSRTAYLRRGPRGRRD